MSEILSACLSKRDFVVSYKFEDLSVGLSLEFTYHFSEDKVNVFAALVDDHAPVHFDPQFAQSQGFSGPLVHGLFVQSVLSGFLGNRMPGPNSVINTFSMKMHKPVLVGQSIHYFLTIIGLTPAVKAVSLGFEGKGASELVVSGKVLCSFR